MRDICVHTRVPAVTQVRGKHTYVAYNFVQDVVSVLPRYGARPDAGNRELRLTKRLAWCPRDVYVANCSTMHSRVSPSVHHPTAHVRHRCDDILDPRYLLSRLGRNLGQHHHHRYVLNAYQPSPRAKNIPQEQKTDVDISRKKSNRQEKGRLYYTAVLYCTGACCTQRRARWQHKSGRSEG